MIFSEEAKGSRTRAGFNSLRLFYMSHKLDRINMVESLKNVECLFIINNSQTILKHISNIYPVDSKQE